MLEGRPWPLRTAGAILLGLEALAIAVRGRDLLGLARLHPRHGYGVGGLLLLVACAVLVVFAACVAADLRWARLSGAAAQVLLAAGSLIRLAARPGASVVGLAVEITVGVLLLVPTTDSRSGHGTTGPRPTPWSPGGSPPGPGTAPPPPVMPR